MYSLLRDSKNKGIYMGENACKNIRIKTYRAVFEIYRKYNSPSYADLWNYNIAAINECGLNYFSTIRKIEPICGLIECIEEKISSKNPGCLNGRLMISFAIRKDLLNKYFENYRIYQKNGGELKIPKLKPRILKTREEVIFGKKSIKISDGKSILIDRNALCNRFEEWLKIYGIDERRGVLMALESLFKEYPVDGLGDNQYYGMITELDKMIFNQEEAPGKKELQVTFSKRIYGKAMQIIHKYNLDANNLSKGHMTFDAYVNNALHLLNTNMPKEYK